MSSHKAIIDTPATASGVSATPAPWYRAATMHTELIMGFRENTEVVIAELDCEIDMTDAENEANAAFIVHAVNNHSALVKALADLLYVAEIGATNNGLDDGEIERSGIFDRVREVLARAALTGAK